MDAQLLDAIIDEIPGQLPAGKGGPWRITLPVVKEYNRSTGWRYNSADEATDHGRAIAKWHLERIEKALGARGTPINVITGYLGGWKNLRRAAGKWGPVATTILANAQGSFLMHEKNEVPPPPPPPPPPSGRAKSTRYSSAASAAWGGLSFLALYMIAKRKGR